MIRQGRRAPDQFYEQPEILPCSEFYWRAYHDLATERQIGMAAGPIPWSKALDYATRQGVVNDDEFQAFWEIIRALDSEQSRLNAPKSNDKKKKPKGGIKT